MINILCGANLMDAQLYSKLLGSEGSWNLYLPDINIHNFCYNSDPHLARLQEDTMSDRQLAVLEYVKPDVILIGFAPIIIELDDGAGAMLRLLLDSK